jgi:hypothetical protein
MMVLLFRREDGLLTAAGGLPLLLLLQVPDGVEAVEACES